jgi:hypothetical protein
MINFYSIDYYSPYWNVEQYIVFSLYIYTLKKKTNLGEIGMKLFCHFVEEDKITQNKYNKKKKKSINKLYNNNKIKYEKSTKPRPYNQKEKKKKQRLK